MYVIIYDTLMKIFWKYLEKEGESEVTCMLEKGEGDYVCDISEIWRLGKNEETMFLFTLYREQKKGGNYPALNLEGKTLPVE